MGVSSEYMSMHCVAGAHGGQKKVADPVELDLQIAAIRWVIGIEPWFPWRSHQCSKWLRHLSSPMPYCNVKVEYNTSRHVWEILIACQQLLVVGKWGGGPSLSLSLCLPHSPLSIGD